MNINTIKERARNLAKGNGGDSALARLHPDLSRREHIHFDENGRVTELLDKYADWAKIYQSYVWVRKAIATKYTAYQYLPVRVVGKNDKEIEGHPLTEVLATINDTTTPAEEWGLWQVDMDMVGEHFLEVVDDSRKRPVEFWRREPQEVKIRSNKERPLYPSPADYILGDDDENPIPPENMIHFKYPNPLNPFRGLSPSSAIRNGVLLDLYIQAWAMLFMKQGGRPDWAIVAPEGITPTEKQDMLDEILAKYSGWKNSHLPIVLEHGVTDIKTFSYPPVEIQWIEQREMIRQEIGAIYGVPDEIMGWGKDTYENFDMAFRVLWLLTLAPTIGFRDVTLTRFFKQVRKILKPHERIATDMSSIGVLQEDLAPKLEQATRLFAMGYPPNDINNRLKLGMPKVPWGNVGYLATNLVPADKVGEKPPEPALPQPGDKPTPPTEEQGSLEGESSSSQQDQLAEQMRQDIAEIKALLSQGNPFIPAGANDPAEEGGVEDDELEAEQEEYHKRWNQIVPDARNIHNATLT